MKRIFYGLIGFLLLVPTAMAGFIDIGGHRWIQSIEWLAEEGIVEGYEDKSFKPDQLINRAEFMKIVMEGVFIGGVEDYYADDCFPDVKKEDWFSKYICYAKEEGIVSGHGDGTFKPSDTITQPEALKILFNTMDEYVVDDGGEWYQKYLDHAEWWGMLYFDPDSPADYKLSRAEMAYFINWLYNPATYVDQIPYEEFYGEGYEESFEDFAMTPDQCLPGEIFDPIDQVCYVECFTDSECEELEELGYIFDDYEGLDEDQEFFYDEGNTIAVYEVDGDEITLVSEGEDISEEFEYLVDDTETHEMIWEYFVNAIPLQSRDMVVRFEIFTDGYDGTLAAVERSQENLDEWVLFVDPLDSFDELGEPTFDFPYTMVHEFGHLLTLNSEQIDSKPLIFDVGWDEAVEECYPNYFVPEGCTFDNSYLNLFFKRFWTDIYEEWDEIQYIWDDTEYYEALDQFYYDYEERFITSYAATNPGEDIAESWAFFVLEDKPEGNSIADQKVLFFYEFDELVKLRKLIRQRIANWE